VSEVVGGSSSIQSKTSDANGRISIRQLRENHLAEADRIFRLAFGIFIGLPDPLQFFAGRELIRPRWLADAPAALAAECDGELIGSNFAVMWGSVGFFGPLTVRPDFWDRGVAKRLLEATMPLFEQRGVRHVGLFTFPHSGKHLGLYQKFGFYPRFLTAVMIREVGGAPPSIEFTRYSALSAAEQNETLRGCREVTELLYEGLDLEHEIRAVQEHRFGDTILVRGGARVDAFAVCHLGAGTEGGPNCCYIKFAATRPGPNAGENFSRLLACCNALAAAEGLASIEAGVNLACEPAYRQMVASGFRPVIHGVAMHKPNESGYLGPNAYVIGDWR
jgi:GNAT superfamily N-acetyltransferase